jgi:hypothetical protein
LGLEIEGRISSTQKEADPTYPAGMRCSSRLVSAVATAALLAAVPTATATASAASPEKGPIVQVELELPASNGLEAHLETSEKKVATLTLTRQDHKGVLGVVYSTRAKVTQEGLRVRFGKLGLIDVGFTPTVTLSSTEPSEGCTGEPRTLREGIFSGTIEFTGEREYVRIEGPQAEGSMSVISPWECPEGEELAPFAGISRLLARRGSKHGSESASLYAARRHCSCLFGAGVRRRKKEGESFFFGVTAKSREGVKIERGTLVKGGAGAFVFDRAAGTATLRPPRPLSGHATFEERPGRDLWRSTIRVPLLGSDPLRTGAPGFRALLNNEY